MLVLVIQAISQRKVNFKKPYPSRYGKKEKGGIGVAEKNGDWSGEEGRAKPLVSVD